MVEDERAASITPGRRPWEPPGGRQLSTAPATRTPASLRPRSFTPCAQRPSPGVHTPKTNDTTHTPIHEHGMGLLSESAPPPKKNRPKPQLFLPNPTRPRPH